MTSSGSYERRGQPRSVVDPHKKQYEAMLRRQAAYNRGQSASLEAAHSHASVAEPPAPAPPDPEHSLPDAVTAALAKSLGSARRAHEEWAHGHKAAAAIHATLELPDLYFDGALLKGALKNGGLKLVGPTKWHVPPWKGTGARKWLEHNGFVHPGEEGHHWLIPQGSWGKAVPDFIKNQPWNIKSLDRLTHGRIHHRVRMGDEWLPQYNAVQRVWHGTPAYFKALLARGAVRATSHATGGQHKRDHTQSHR